MSDRLTKADVVALWHAVQDMALMDKAMGSDSTFSAEQKQASGARVKAARSALAKLHAMRRGLVRGKVKAET